MNLLEDDSSRRIVLLTSPKGYGKTLMLKHFEPRLSDMGFISIYLDRIDRTHPLEMLVHLRNKLSKDVEFKSFDALTDTPFSVNIENNKQVGKGNQISVTVLNNVFGYDFPIAYYFLQKLTIAWVDDVYVSLPRLGRRLIMIIDSYESFSDESRIDGTSGPSPRAWFEQDFVPNVALKDNLWLIVAGREIPKPQYPWATKCQCLELMPMMKADDWMDAAREINSRISRQLVSAICHAYGGDPSKIASFIERLRSWDYE